MTRRNPYPWIVFSGSFGKLLCQRCGETYEPALPASINIYLAICKAFTSDHRKCRESKP